MSTEPESHEERCARILHEQHIEQVFGPAVRAALLALEVSPPERPTGASEPDRRS